MTIKYVCHNINLLNTILQQYVNPCIIKCKCCPSNNDLTGEFLFLVTASMSIDDDVYIRGSNLGELYRAVEIHFHWGPDNGVGSEHLLDDHHHPLEVRHHHTYHYIDIIQARIQKFFKGGWGGKFWEKNVCWYSINACTHKTRHICNSYSLPFQVDCLLFVLLLSFIFEIWKGGGATPVTPPPFRSANVIYGGKIAPNFKPLSYMLRWYEWLSLSGAHRTLQYQV